MLNKFLFCGVLLIILSMSGQWKVCGNVDPSVWDALSTGDTSCGRWAQKCCETEMPCENKVLACHTDMCCPDGWIFDKDYVCCDANNPKQCCSSFQCFVANKYAMITKRNLRILWRRQTPRQRKNMLLWCLITSKDVWFESLQRKQERGRLKWVFGTQIKHFSPRGNHEIASGR